MAITVKVIDRNSAGKWHWIETDVTFDTSYTTGGYTINPGDVGLGAIRRVYTGSMNAVGSGITRPYWDYTNSKLMALRTIGSAPPAIIVDEAVTVTANAGRLANVPAYILAINASAGGVTGGFSVVPTGSTLATTQCDV